MARLKHNDPEILKLKKMMILKPGMRAGRLTLLEPTQDKGWICKCDCGNIKVVSPKRVCGLKNQILGADDNTGSCGCKWNNYFKEPNNAGTIKSKYQTTTYGGAKILYETTETDDNRSYIVICECQECGRPFRSTRRHGECYCGSCAYIKNMV